ncbi:hypothetical protein FGE12_13020 [Aggregicoccus sp. 17bor-14]|uniref:hypothetical protein n=1 Tax=Myxococcaceae TaxID=31 RepID=UPI00129C612B|nr:MULTISPECIES: hypothetical protein [Myxococcaceae]MBF5043312.1 hypothetical protein [Simulacricoccus sp. 17bor-14]MRI89071.1 hypothetical protein [Aggregicoccus sp. 17bor-14]
MMSTTLSTPASSAAVHAAPGARAVLREQVRAVALVLRAPALVAAALLALATVLSVAQLRGGAGPLGFHPELSMVPGMVGLLLPLFVWRGEPRFGPAFLWTLPVDRRQHALAKVLAGWVWLMAAVALLFLWLLALTLFSGGNLLSEETLRLLPGAIAGGRDVDPAALGSVQWTPSPLLWLVPFTAASGAYLVASALMLGLRHPLRWLAGAVLAVFLLLSIGQAVRAGWLADGVERGLQTFAVGRYGLDTLFTARTESLHTEVTLTTGETLGVWRAPPDLGLWARATLLWLGAGLALLWAAASRHRERRRA